MNETTVNDLREGLGSTVVAFTFWAAIAILGVSGLLALSKMSWKHPSGGGARVLVTGLATAFLIALLPRLTTIGSDLAGGVVGGGEGGGAQHPGVMEYVAALSPDGLWIAGSVVAVWAVAVVGTIAVGLSRLGSKTE